MKKVIIGIIFSIVLIKINWSDDCESSEYFCAPKGTETCTGLETTTSYYDGVANTDNEDQLYCKSSECFYAPKGTATCTDLQTTTNYFDGVANTGN